MRSSPIPTFLIFCLTLISAVLNFPRSGVFAAEPDVAFLEQRLSLDPENLNLKKELVVACLRSAQEYARLKDWPKAIALGLRAQRVMPAEEKIKGILSFYANEQGLDFYAQKKYRKAIDSLKKGMDYSPGSGQLKKNLAVVYIGYASVKFTEGEYDASALLLVEAEKYDRENAWLYVLKGELALVRDNYYAASENWELALSLDPALSEIREKLVLLEKEKQTEINYKLRFVDKFKVKFDDSINKEFLETVLRTLPETYRKIGKDFDCFSLVMIPVTIYPRKEISDNYFPQWAAGAYDGKIRLVESNVWSERDIQAVIYHEYAHVLLYEIGRNNVPFWLGEGLAEYVSRQFKARDLLAQRQKRLVRALKDQTAFSIAELSLLEVSVLSGMPQEKIDLAYAQAASFTGYLVDNFSLFEVKKIILSLGQGDNIDQAVADILNVELEALERDWRKGLLANDK